MTSFTDEPYRMRNIVMSFTKERNKCYLSYLGILLVDLAALGTIYFGSAPWRMLS